MESTNGGGIPKPEVDTVRAAGAERQQCGISGIDSPVKDGALVQSGAGA